VSFEESGVPFNSQTRIFPCIFVLRTVAATPHVVSCATKKIFPLHPSNQVVASHP
jgi:hypothetical protein